MKYEWVFLGACLCACGSGDDVTDGGTDATTNDGPVADQAVDQSTGDAGSDAAQDTGSDVVDAGVADGFSFECTNPTQCDSGYCCGSLTTGPGTFPNCPPVSGNSKCTSSCTSNASLSCSSTSTIRICGKKADCNEALYGECCTFQAADSGAQYYICVNALAKGYATGCF